MCASMICAITCATLAMLVLITLYTLKCFKSTKVYRAFETLQCFFVGLATATAICILIYGLSGGSI